MKVNNFELRKKKSNNYLISHLFVLTLQTNY